MNKYILFSISVCMSIFLNYSLKADARFTSDFVDEAKKIGIDLKDDTEEIESDSIIDDLHKKQKKGEKQSLPLPPIPSPPTVSVQKKLPPLAPPVPSALPKVDGNKKVVSNKIPDKKVDVEKTPTNVESKAVKKVDVEKKISAPKVSKPLEVPALPPVPSAVAKLSAVQSSKGEIQSEPKKIESIKTSNSLPTVSVPTPPLAPQAPTVSVPTPPTVSIQKQLPSLAPPPVPSALPKVDGDKKVVSNKIPEKKVEAKKSPMNVESKAVKKVDVEKKISAPKVSKPLEVPTLPPVPSAAAKLSAVQSSKGKIQSEPKKIESIKTSNSLPTVSVPTPPLAPQAPTVSVPTPPAPSALSKADDKKKVVSNKIPEKKVEAKKTPINVGSKSVKNTSIGNNKKTIKNNTAINVPNKKKEEMIFISPEKKINNKDIDKHYLNRRKPYDNKTTPPKYLLELQEKEKNKDFPRYLMQQELSRLLFVAVNEDDIGAIKSLLQKGADINAQDANNDYTPLMYAIKNNKISSLKYLIIKGADVNVKSKNLMSPLHFAAIINNIKAISVLLKSNIDMFALDKKHETFYEYINKDYINIVINDIFEREKNPDKSLFDFCKLGSLDGVLYSLQHRANVNAINENGDTPLIVSIRYNKKDVLLTLLKFGADLSKEDKYGNDVYYIAKSNRDKEIYNVLETVKYNMDLYVLGITDKIVDYKIASSELEELIKENDINGFYNFEQYPTQGSLTDK
ncbi:MAG: ankyrin repeat protein [Candidatus Midichloriaceae bacterium]|jgi:ankyrin repeat protein